MAYGWEGELVRLVPLDKAKHLENAVLWMNDPEVTHWLLVGDYPLSRRAEEAYFDRHGEVNENDIAWAIETLEGKHVGFSGLHQISHFHKIAISGTVLGDKEAWGKGYGTDAARVRARYAFDVLGLRMIESGILEGNERSIKMQEKVGYKVVGRIPKKYWKRGAYRDSIVTLLTPETFQPS
jgi:RimJ/RimL family protein N-acetyltransferase